MKRYAALLVIAGLCLLAACTGLTSAAFPPSRSVSEPPEAEGEKPLYQLDTLSAQEWFTAEDGTDLAHYSYQLLTLTVSNLEELSPQSRAAAERNMDSFNTKMVNLLDESVAVRLDTGSYTGGAHPNSYTSSLLFDLGAGQFIDAAQIAEDPETFRVNAAALLLERAEALDERGSFWPEYADIIACWNEGTVLFDAEGMRVVFSHYVLGPYSMGTVELRLSYGELAALVGAGGMERLGRGEA